MIPSFRRISTAKSFPGRIIILACATNKHPISVDQLIEHELPAPQSWKKWMFPVVMLLIGGFDNETIDGWSRRVRH